VSSVETSEVQLFVIRHASQVQQNGSYVRSVLIAQLNALIPPVLLFFVTSTSASEEDARAPRENFSHPEPFAFEIGRVGRCVK
jgi:hypothetical protein